MPINRRMDKEVVVFIYNGILLRLKKRNIATGTWMDLKNIILSEVSQAEKDKYHISLIGGI